MDIVLSEKFVTVRTKNRKVFRSGNERVDCSSGEEIPELPRNDNVEHRIVRVSLTDVRLLELRE